MRLDQGVREASELCGNALDPTVLLVADALRPLVHQMAKRHDPAPRVLAISELPDTQQIKSVGRVGGMESLAGAAA